MPEGNEATPIVEELPDTSRFDRADGVEGGPPGEAELIVLQRPPVTPPQE